MSALFSHPTKDIEGQWQVTQNLSFVTDMIMIIPLTASRPQCAFRWRHGNFAPFSLPPQKQHPTRVQSLENSQSFNRHENHGKEDKQKLLRCRPIPVIHFLAPTEIGDFARKLFYACGHIVIRVSYKPGIRQLKEEKPLAHLHRHSPWFMTREITTTYLKN